MESDGGVKDCGGSVLQKKGLHLSFSVTDLFRMTPRAHWRQKKNPKMKQNAPTLVEHRSPPEAISGFCVKSELPCDCLA